MEKWHCEENTATLRKAEACYSSVKYLKHLADEYSKNFTHGFL